MPAAAPNRDLAALLALLWSPPDTAAFDSAAEAREHARNLVDGLLTAANGQKLTSEEVDTVRAAIKRIAAADYLPGDDPEQWHSLPANATVRHPMSPPFDAPISAVKAKSEITDALGICIGKMPVDQQTPRNLAQAIWRLLPDWVSPEEGHAPFVAQPGYPDSVWAAGAVRAAAVAAGPEPAILMFTLAAVQDYIGQARRTQDLWMGSYLYAWFMWHAMLPIVECYGPWAIVAPSLRGLPFADEWLRRQGVSEVPEPTNEALAIASLPNVFTALVPLAHVDTCVKRAIAGLTAARDRIASAVREHVEPAMINAVARKLGRDAPSTADWEKMWETWQGQIGAFLTQDIFWATAPWTDSPETDRARLEAVAGKLSPDQQPWVKWAEAAKLVGAVPDGAGYPLATILAARLLNARKNRRDFAALEHQQEGPLCTLCASRVALHPRGLHADPFWQILGAYEGENRAGGDAKLQGRIRANERLCAVCAVKRFALDAYFDGDTEKMPKPTARRAKAGEEALALNRHQFPSTATVATFPFRESLLGQLAPQAAAGTGELLDRTVEWLKALNEAVSAKVRVPANLPKGLTLPESAIAGSETLGALNELDGSWFYGSDYDVESVQREFDIELSEKNKTAIGPARQKLASMIATLRPLAGEAFRPPARYYAVLAMDGDKVGEWLRGLKNPTFAALFNAADNAIILEGGLQRPPGPLSQAALAGAQRDFSLRDAPDLVRLPAYRGALIYAGGDDVLALVPREKVLPLAIALRDRFRAPMSQHSGDYLLGDQATISAGIVIAQQGDPLAEIIQRAHHELEETAKNRFGRDAFAIRIEKGSSYLPTAGLHWDVPGNREDRTIPVASRLYELQLAFAGGLSRGYLDDVRRAGVAFGPGSPCLSDDEHALACAELVRLTRRHTERMTDDERNKTVASVQALYWAARNALARRETGDTTFEDPDPPGQEPAGRMTAWELVSRMLGAAEFLAREDET